MASNRVFSGHCRIEAAAGDGQALFLEGMRIHLDLQLEPEETAPLPGGSRSGRQADATKTDRVAHRRVPVGAWAMPTYQQWAVLAALTSLLLALASWWVGEEPAQPAAEPTDAISNASLQPKPAEQTSAAPALTPAALTPPAEPPVAVVPVPAAPPAAAAPGLTPPARPVATAAADTSRPPPPRATNTGARAPLAAERAGARVNGGEQARAPGPRFANADRLDLFGDTK